MDILSNKYFTIAVIIVLIVVLYLYSQRKSCDYFGEGMHNIDDNDVEEVDEEFVEEPTKQPRSRRRKYRKRRGKWTKKRYPQPVDNRPDLGQCVPCVCPSDGTDTDTSESD